MKGKRNAILTVCCVALASCSFSINFSGHSTRSSEATSSSSEPSATWPIIPSSDSSSSSEESSSSATWPIIPSSSSVPSSEQSSVAPAVQKTKIAQYYTDYTENNIYDIESAPTHGNCRFLVIPIWFTDSSTYIQTSMRENVRADIEKAYFGSSSETGWHSVKTYYETESKGAVTISGTVSEWYELGQRMSMYATGNQNTTTLAVSAKNWYFNNHPSDSPKNYDGDGDGYIDGVMLIYAAPNYDTLNRSDYSNLWAYCYWVQDQSQKSYTNPGTNVFFWASYDFLYSSGTARSRAGTNYAAGDTSYCNIDAHCFIHEMGHVFGLDDYYDYGPNRYCPAAGFSMQDYNIGGHDPFSTMAFGWSDPYIPTSSCSITIGAFQSTHDLILLTPSWNSFNSPFDEYLLLELWTPTGLNSFDCAHNYKGQYPTGPSVPGIRLWHVDARLLYIEMDQGAYENQMTSNARYASYYGVTHAFSNSVGNEDYGSPLGSAYDSYDLLRLVRNDTYSTTKDKNSLTASSLFRSGSSFNMSSFSRQFPRSSLLNSGKSLGWSFSVSISGSGENATATINLVRG